MWRINFLTIQLLTNILLFPEGRDVSASGTRAELLSVLDEQIQLSEEEYERKCDWMIYHTAQLWRWRQLCDSSVEAEDTVDYHEQNDGPGCLDSAGAGSRERT